MKEIAGDRSCRSVANSQEPGFVKKEETRYESALREIGIEKAFVARKLKELLRAQGQRWNPKKGSWEKFEDYGTQLGALREIAKILGIYLQDARKESEDEGKVLHIDISAIPKRRERVLPTTNHQQDSSG